MELQDVLNLLTSISLILIVLSLFMVSSKVRKVSNITSMLMSKPNLIKYDEKEIISHLEYLVSEVIDFYAIINLSSANIYYITSKMEKDMIETITNSVSERISQTLLDELSLIYNKDFVGKFIGEYIYLKVSEFVVMYNTENGGSKMNDNNTNVL
nr:MAG TPA: hypothetical protein [Bacteriophage sp.]